MCLLCEHCYVIRLRMGIAKLYDRFLYDHISDDSPCLYDFTVYTNDMSIARSTDGFNMITKKCYINF